MHILKLTVFSTSAGACTQESLLSLLVLVLYSRECVVSTSVDASIQKSL